MAFPRASRTLIVLGDAGRYERLHAVAKGDQRDPGQTDRDRVLYSSAFKRLAGVTQVVSAAEGTVFHNRLTHSLKVAQLARRLAEHLVVKQRKLAEAWGGLDPEVVEAAALAHDIGHPPFGHVAEKTLNELVQAAEALAANDLNQEAKERLVSGGKAARDTLKYAGDPDGFEGNAQSVRTVTKLAAHRINRQLSAPVPGLDLSRATLRALMKYPWHRDFKVPLNDRRYQKFSVYRSESEILSWAYLGEGAPTRTLEAEIMDFADGVAYSVHDLEDFIRAGLIPLARLSQPAEFDRFIRHWIRDRPWVEETVKDEAAQKMLRDAIAMVDTGHDYSGTFEDRAALRTRTSALISRYLPSVKIADPGSESPLRYDPDFKLEMHFFQRLVWYYVIQHPALATQQDGQRRLITNLFRAFMEATEPQTLGRGSERTKVIPAALQQDLERVMDLDEPERYHARLRLAADAICSFTDAEAITMHNRLLGVAPGSVTDVITH